jgi:superoxide reductase
MSNTKFYVCKTCGNLVGLIHSAGPKLSCCGKEMSPLIPGETEASTEKHLPVVLVESNRVTVRVGEVDHPMTKEHLIDWVYLETTRGGMRANLSAEGAPEAVFTLAEGERATCAYAYCNLHGLWKTALSQNA